LVRTTKLTQFKIYDPYAQIATQLSIEENRHSQLKK